MRGVFLLSMRVMCLLSPASALANDWWCPQGQVVSNLTPVSAISMSMEREGAMRTPVRRRRPGQQFSTPMIAEC